jgi:hypothetical protein
MPERRALRRRPDQQLPVHEHGLVHASSVQPLRVGPWLTTSIRSRMTPMGPAREPRKARSGNK